MQSRLRPRKPQRPAPTIPTRSWAPSAFGDENVAAGSRVVAYFCPRAEIWRPPRNGRRIARIRPVMAAPRYTVPVKLAEPPPASAASSIDAQAVRILARSFYKELRSNGYTPQHLLAVSTE